MIKPINQFKTFLIVLLLPFLIALPLQTNAATVEFAVEKDMHADSLFWTTPVDYIALGDSLAAGMDFNGGMGKSYADYLAEKINSLGYLNTYSKSFSYPGYTAAKVLSDLQENVSRDIDGTSIAIRDAVKDAELITISAGANDVLGLIEVAHETGNVTFDQAKLTEAIQQVGVNTMKILAEVNELNPHAQIYVMGYYNPFPQLPDHLQPILTQLLASINMAIGMATDNPNVYFVETGKVIAENPLVYLPNPENIHLSEAGYRKVTEQFWSEMEASYSWTAVNSLTAELFEKNTVVLNWEAAESVAGINKYEIYEGTTMVAEVAGDVLTYKVENLEENQLYNFSVQAVDEEGVRSPHQPKVDVTTGETPPLFSDIKGHWAEEYIEQAAIAGMLYGHKDGSFKPNKDLTRAQAASILVRALQLQTEEVAPFKDITSYDEKTVAEINAAYKYGLVKGSKGNFMPSKPVTRAQLALMIDRAYTVVTGEKYIVSGKAPYPDFGNADQETVNAITVLYELRIATGSAGKFNPSGFATRAHAAKMFVNFSLLR